MRRIFPVVLLNLLACVVQGEPSVSILAENLEQVVTSSTLQWVPSHGLNDTMLESAVVAAYQVVDDQFSGEDAAPEKKPVYVCRAKINSLWISGQLRPKKRVCIVSNYKQVSEHLRFEVLINIENSARLSWAYRDKYKLNPQGAVTSGDGDVRTYVGRHQANSHDKKGSLSHFAGIFNPSENLGVFDVVDQNNMELRFEDGEILVETEPVSYELKSIKFDKMRSRQQKTRQLLGEASLRNPENGVQKVETVITYNNSYSLFWGKGHGLLTGLNFTVHLSNGTNLSGNWGLHINKPIVETEVIQKFLDEGTGVNVTLYGNYTESEVPYSALVVAIYKDKERKEHIISDSKRENRMMDVVVEYGPVYYLHNNTHVPTTTTTTTSTTTTSTTTKSTSTTQEAMPIVPPHVTVVENSEKKREEPVSSTNRKHENNSMMSDDGDADSDALEMKKDSSRANASTLPLVDCLLGLSLLVIVRRVT